jgi:hypothetical protein
LIVCALLRLRRVCSSQPKDFPNTSNAYVRHFLPCVWSVRTMQFRTRYSVC